MPRARPMQRSADAEAVTHVTTALDLLESLPETPERARQELDLRLTVGPALMATKGLGAPEVEATYTRALVLGRQLGQTTELFPALVGLRTFHQVRGELLKARELGEQLLALAQEAQDVVMLVSAHRGMGATLFSLGSLEAARSHLEQALALYDPRQHESPAFYSGSEPGVVGLAFLALDLWQLGYPDQAVARSREMLALAQTLSHPPASASALIFAAELHLQRREAQKTDELTTALLALAAEHGLPFILAWGTIISGWAMAAQGRVAEGIEQMRQGLSAHEATGAKLRRTHFLALLAEAYGKAGQVEAGRRTLDEALEVMEQTQERTYEAELHRLRGELTLLGTVGEGQEAGRDDKAEACFAQAIAIAKRQGAKSLQLRASTCLARLWQRQGKRAQARAMLDEVYQSFTEGFDTPDLQEAKALLAALSSP